MVSARAAVATEVMINFISVDVVFVIMCVLAARGQLLCLIIVKHC